jgi:hypothetical protein
MSIIERTGREKQKGILLKHKGTKVEVDTLMKIMLEMVVKIRMQIRES